MASKTECLTAHPADEQVNKSDLDERDRVCLKIRALQLCKDITKKMDKLSSRSATGKPEDRPTLLH
jgi:hypothetical protein